MSKVLKGLLIILVVAYIVSPDFIVGPMDDILACLLCTGGMMAYAKLNCYAIENSYEEQGW